MLMDYFKKMKKEKRVYDSDSYTRTAIPETKQKESLPVSSLPGILIDRPVNQLKFTRTGSVSSTSNLFHPCKPILEILPFSIYTMPCGIRILNGIKPVSTIVTKTNGRNAIIITSNSIQFDALFAILRKASQTNVAM